MSDLIIVDTDVLIDIARSVAEAISCLQAIERQVMPAISVITQMELIVGCRNKAELQTLASFLTRFKVVKLSEKISDMGIDLLRQYRLSHNLLIADSLIAATALSLDCALVTKNQRDYRFITGLHLPAYPHPF
jgi:predicted nucleic acid-binding protein